MDPGPHSTPTPPRPPFPAGNSSSTPFVPRSPLPPPASRGSQKPSSLGNSYGQRSVVLHSSQSARSNGTLALTTATDRSKSSAGSVLRLKDTPTAPSLHSLSNWPAVSPSFDGRPSTVRSDGSLSARTAKGRPPLAIELETFIRRETFSLSQQLKRDPSVFERLPIFAEAFGTLATHFLEYSEVISVIKREYDHAASEGAAAVTELLRLRADANSAKEFYSYMLDCEKGKADEVLRQVTHDLQCAKNEISALKTRERKFLEDIAKTSEKMEKMTSELDDMHQRNKLLSETLRTETMRQAVTVKQGKKLKTDNDRLQHLCKELEIKIKNDQVLLVSSGPPAGGVAPAVGGLGAPVGAGGGGGGMTLQPPGMHGSLNASARPTSNVASPLLQTAHGGSRTGLGDVAKAVMQQKSPGRSGHQDQMHASAYPSDFEDPEERLERTGRIKRLMRIVARLHHKVKVQQQTIQQLSQERSDRPTTPRPHWENLAKVVPELTGLKEAESSETFLQRSINAIREAFSEKQKAVELQALSNTVTDWFSSQNLVESDLVHEPRKHFIGLGTGPHVPVYLRYHGFVAHKPSYTKGVIEGYLKEFWELRQDRARAEGLDSKEIDEFFCEWLDNKAKGKKIELAYNFLDICERSKSDPDCGMFLSILQGRVSEATLVDQLSVVERLQFILEHNDKAKTGYLPRRMFHDLLRRFFPAKGKSDMLKLRFALINFTKTTPKGPIISYAQAFEEDEEGNQTRFIELIREQHLDEITVHTIDVEESLRAVIHGNKLTIGAAKTAIKLLDSAIPNDELEHIVAHGAHLTQQQLEGVGEGHTVAAEEFLRRIRTGVLLKRHSKKPTFGDDDESDNEDELSIRELEGETGRLLDGDDSDEGSGSDDDGSEEDAEVYDEDLEPTSEEEDIDFTSMDTALEQEAISRFPVDSEGQVESTSRIRSPNAPLSSQPSLVRPPGGAKEKDRDSASASSRPTSRTSSTSAGSRPTPTTSAILPVSVDSPVVEARSSPLTGSAGGAAPPSPLKTDSRRSSGPGSRPQTVSFTTTGDE